MLLQTIFFIAAAGLLYFCWCGNSALVAPCLRNSRELLVRLYNVRATHARAHVFTTNGVINQKCLHCTHTLNGNAVVCTWLATSIGWRNFPKKMFARFCRCRIAVATNVACNMCCLRTYFARSCQRYLWLQTSHRIQFFAPLPHLPLQLMKSAI